MNNNLHECNFNTYTNEMRYARHSRQDIKMTVIINVWLLVYIVIKFIKLRYTLTCALQ